MPVEYKHALFSNLCNPTFYTDKKTLEISLHTHDSITCILEFEPRHEKTNVLHMQKQSRRSASR